jgi:hypothetical protein
MLRNTNFYKVNLISVQHQGLLDSRNLGVVSNNLIKRKEHVCCFEGNPESRYRQFDIISIPNTDKFLLKSRQNEGFLDSRNLGMVN